MGYNQSMPEDLIKTKFFAPPARPNQVPRQALLEKCQETRQLGIQLTLISAPAGFGKTSLASDWVRTSGLPFTWLTLDEGDNDPPRFWRYVLAALEMIDGQIGKSIQPALNSVQPPDIRQVVTRIVNDIVNTEIEFILVIEDYHIVEQAEMHDSVNFLLDHLPPRMHLVLTTRSDPPLNLALRRGRGQIAEIRALDLRFDPAEAAQFLNQTMHLGLAIEDIEALNLRTEGWITGLQMAALSLQDEIDRHAFITAFSGNDRYIADYLIEEVLLHQPIEFQRFLLQTSILDRLCAPLCDAVTGRQDSQALLNTLARANLFILPLDNHREWFRYHNLFAELLRRRLIQSEEEQAVQKLRQRAVDWLVENGFLKLAVEYAVSFGEYELAVRLMIQTSGLYFQSNEFNTLLKLGDRMPNDLIQRNIALSCILAWAANATAQNRKVEQIIRAMEAQLGVTIDDFIAQGDSLHLAAEAKAGLIELGVVRARMNVDTFDLASTFRLADHLLPCLTVERDREPYAFNLPSKLRGSMMFIQGLAQHLHGDTSLAGWTFQNAALDGKRTQNLHIEVLSMGHLGETQILQGHLHSAQQTFLQALAVPSESMQSTPFYGISQAGLGTLAYEWNDRPSAQEYFQNAVELGKLWHSWETLQPAFTGLAHLHASQGNWEAAYQALDQLLENTQENQSIIQASVDSQRALLNLRQGNLETASRWTEAFKPDLPQDYRLAWEAVELISARIWIAAAQIQKAAALLESIIQQAHAAGRGRRVHEALCLQAVLFVRTHQEPEAQRALIAALKMAEPEGYLRSYLDEAKSMQELLGLALKRDWLPAPLESYAHRLLSAFETYPFRPEQASRLIEPLTERELEVLQHIAEGLTNPEIAHGLYLSPNTLKAHTQNIYTKLDVHNRVNAVSKARKLGLIQ